MSEVKPCPYCGCQKVEVFPTFASGFFAVRCYACHMYGPNSEKEDCAVERWNDLPRRLRWTKEKPTTCDFYWYKSDGGSVEIGIVYADVIGNLCVHFAGEEDPHLLELVVGEWAGPIPEPE